MLLASLRRASTRASSSVALSLSLVAAAGCGSGDDGRSGAGGGGSPPIDPFPLPANAYSHGDPSANEQALLELVQRARANPAAEGPLLVDEPDVAGAIMQFGVDKQKVVADFASYPATPPLAFDPRLMASSRFHSEDMATNGFQQHDGSAGETFVDRIQQQGYKFSYISENIFAYASSVPYCHAAFLIDWGNPDLGHRDAILDLDSPKRDIGISIIENPSSPKVGPLVVTQDFGEPLDASQRYVVGVAYADANENGAFDPGEGVANLSVVPDHGASYAVTSTSGGYAIPMPKNDGAFQVQIQRDGVVLQEKSGSMDGVNVKIDFTLAP